MKTLIILLLGLLISQQTQSQLNIVHFEHSHNKEGYHGFDIQGQIYLTEDSIAIYLYEPLMEQMVLYNPVNYNGFFKGYLYGLRPHEVIIWRQNDEFHIRYKKIKTILRIAEEEEEEKEAVL